MAIARLWIPLSFNTRSRAEDSFDPSIPGATLRLPCKPIPSHSTRAGQSYVSNHWGRMTCGTPALGRDISTFLSICVTPSITYLHASKNEFAPPWWTYASILPPSKRDIISGWIHGKILTLSELTRDPRIFLTVGELSQSYLSFHKTCILGNSRKTAWVAIVICSASFSGA